MNFNHLYYFRELAQLENYTEASKKLLISQPSLSYAMKKLESNLDVPLFEKRGRNVGLTGYGQELKKATDEVFAILTNTLEQINQQKNNQMNTLKIGLVPTLASNFFPEIMYNGKLSGKLTQNFDLFNGFTNQIITKLAKEEYDIGICSKEDRDDFIFIPIKKQPFVLLINQVFYDSLIKSKGNWFDYPLVTYRDAIPIGRSARSIIHSYTDQPNIVAEFDDETFIGGYVDVNPCVALVAKTPFLKQFQLVTIPLDEENIYHTVYLAYLKKNAHLQKIQPICELLQAASDFL